MSHLETKLSGEIARLDAKINMRVAELKADIVRWVFGIAVAQARLILACCGCSPACTPNRRAHCSTRG